MAISRSLIPQQISKGGKMPRVGEKHFKYTKEGREKAKKHAKKTGQEIKYMGGGVVNRKYYAMGGKIQAMRKKKKEKKKGRSALAGAQAALAGMTIGESFRSFGQKFGQDPSRAGHVGKLRKMEEEYSQIMKDLLKSGKGSRGKSKAQNKASGGVVNRKYYAMGGKVKKAPSKFIERRKIFSGAKALGKFPFVGRPFRQIAKAGEAASKFIKRRKKLSGAKALKGKK